jgi:ankyrin repeat protein
MKSKTRRAPCASCLLAAMLSSAAAVATAATGTGAPPIFQALAAFDVEAVRRIVAADPGQAAVHDDRGTSAVLRALFTIRDQSFLPPQNNEVLHLLLAQKPPLDLFEACAVGSPEKVSTLLEADPRGVRSWSRIGWTPLHFAAFGGNLPVIKLLTDRGAQVNERARNEFRNMPLAVSLLTGQLDAARALIERGADVDARQAGGIAPIHEAALVGRRDIIDLLLENGAEIGARANDGRNALSEAERGRHPDTVAYLRTRGATGPQITADLSAEPKK